MLLSQYCSTPQLSLKKSLSYPRLGITPYLTSSFKSRRCPLSALLLPMMGGFIHSAAHQIQVCVEFPVDLHNTYKVTMETTVTAAFFPSLIVTVQSLTTLAPIGRTFQDSRI